MLASAQRYVGGDISLLPTYEEHGVHYLDQNGDLVSDLVPWLGSEAQWNAQRVRLFHTPSNATSTEQEEGVWQDLDYVTALCQRIKSAGMSLMLDIHYSDTWTDPSKHSTPAAWTSTDPTVLADSVYEYTKMVLNHLKDNNVVPEWIQVGNEVNVGMLWPTGKCYANGTSVTTDGVTGTWANFLSYLQAGVKACREVSPTSEIVIHTAMDQSGWAATTLYNTLGSDLDYDIIGLSYYPDYHGTLSTLSSVISTLESKHSDKEIMIVEPGYGAQWSLSGDYTSTVSATWPATEAGQKAFTDDLITELLTHENVTGLFWWLPEDNEFWADSDPARSSWWNASLYKQNAGTPWAAMFQLKNFLAQDATGVEKVESTTSTSASQSGIYNLQGQKVSTADKRGVYIENGRKVIRNK